MAFVFLGELIIVWAALDLGMNITRAGLDLSGRSNVIEYCTIAQLGRYFHATGVFLAFDTLVSFLIICITLWSGWITRLTTIESLLWYAATTLNLISLSLVIIYDEALRARLASPGKKVISAFWNVPSLHFMVRPLNFLVLCL